MKTLDIEATHRDYLKGRGGLCHDLDGDEALLGLSYKESIIYLQMLEGTAKNIFARRFL